MTSCAPATVAVNDFSTRTALPASDRGQGDRVVLRVRGGDVEDVDVFVFDHLLVGAVRARQPVAGRKVLRSVERTAGHGDRRWRSAHV